MINVICFLLLVLRSNVRIVYAVFIALFPCKIIWKKKQLFSQNNANNWTKQMKKWNTQKWRKEREKNCMIYYYNLWFGFAFECVTSAYMCGLMKTIVIWTRPITFNCIFTFHTTNRQCCYFHKKIKLFHSKRSTILCLAKIRNVEFKQKNEPN